MCKIRLDQPYTPCPPLPPPLEFRDGLSSHPLYPFPNTPFGDHPKFKEAADSN